jgi:hypothetical protein
VDNFVESDRENPEKARRHRLFPGRLKFRQSIKSFKINHIYPMAFVKPQTQKNRFFYTHCVYIGGRKMEAGGRKASKSHVWARRQKLLIVSRVSPLPLAGEGGALALGEGRRFIPEPYFPG